MKIIKIKALPNGAHKNQTGDFASVPDGWAVIPDDMTCKNFPFGEVEVMEIDGIMTVTGWTPGTMPEPVAEQPTQLDILEAQVTYTAMMTDTLLGG